MATTAYLTHPLFEQHQMQAGHPESPERLRAIRTQLEQAGIWQQLAVIEAPKAERSAVERVHSAEYLTLLDQVAPGEGLVNIDPDTALNSYTLPAAWHAAGAAVHAVDLVMRGEVSHAFAAVRPPGHHAEPARAMGFCLIDNIAVAAAHALETHGLERVAICDFDVHHGNGTEVIFHDDPRVLLCSSFQHPYYPFSDPLSDRPYIIKSPLAAGSGSADFRAAVRQHWLPEIERFQPQLLLISAGFDGHREDLLADLNLEDEDYGWITGQLLDCANKHADGRLVSVLEGGYALPALARSVVQHISAMLAT